MQRQPDKKKKLVKNFKVILFALLFICQLRVPAGGSVAWNDFTQASVQAVVRLHRAGALTRRAVHGAIARIAQALRLVGPTVYHAAGKLIAGQELAGICLVS